MRATGQIIAREHRNGLGQLDGITFDWVGGNTVEISYFVIDHASFLDVWQRGSIIGIGPYRLRIIENRPDLATFVCAREGPLAWLWAALYRATRWLDLAYRRLILTAACRGLAECPPYTVPTWRCLRLPWR